MVKMDKIEIVGYSLQEMLNFFENHGIPGFRGKQVFHWIHQKNASSFQHMHNLPEGLQRILTDLAQIKLLEVLETRESQDGTIKYLSQLKDGQTIESVLIPDLERSTVCISSQVGCGMGCSFCATGQGGLARNLSSGEIVAQVLEVQARLPEGHHVTNIVFMGMGEPFANFTHVMRALAILNASEGLDIGMRRMTISTCGLAPQIREFANAKTQAVLAVSLHAADDEKRSQIMPINHRYPLSEVISACRYYTEETRRRVSFEYALIHDFNDTADDVSNLTELLRGLLCHVNLIPVNPVDPSFARPTNYQVRQFATRLERAGIPVSTRQERGTDIEAACGQLRQKRGSSPHEGDGKN